MSTDAISGNSLFGSDDGLAKVADLFTRISGKELSSDALHCLMFFEANGSSDLAASILAKKMYQVSPGELAKFIEKLSPAQHAKDMLAAQTEARAASMKGM